MSNFCTPSPIFCLSEWVQIGHDPTAPGRQNFGYCLEHCLDSNNTYTNYSSGHPISVDPLPLTPLVTTHFRMNFDHFLPDPPSPPSSGCQIYGPNLY